VPVITILKRKAGVGSSTIDEYEPDGEAAKEFAALADAIEGLPL
jgi:hypothetical protein